jgi:RNA polymerase sigma-70 factor (ECF subfamily)
MAMTASDPGSPITTIAGQEQAFRLFLQHQTMLLAYIRAIVRDTALAEDALSDTSIAIVRAFPGYQPLRPFAPWARGVARRVALEALRRWHGHGAPHVLDEDVLESVGTRLDQLTAEEGLERRRDALAHCLEGLRAGQRELLRCRYTEGQAYEAIAAHAGRTVNAIYVAMHRLHNVLSDCIRRHLESSA